MSNTAATADQSDTTVYIDMTAPASGLILITSPTGTFSGLLGVDTRNTAGRISRWYAECVGHEGCSGWYSTRTDKRAVATALAEHCGLNRTSLTIEVEYEYTW